MGRTACTEPQCLYKDALYLFTLHKQRLIWREDHCKDTYKSVVELLHARFGPTTCWIRFYRQFNRAAAVHEAWCDGGRKGHDILIRALVHRQLLQRVCQAVSVVPAVSVLLQVVCRYCRKLFVYTEWHKKTGTFEMRSGSERMHTWRRTPSTGRNFQTLIIWITVS